jgi:hypothetical protein
MRRILLVALIAVSGCSMGMGVRRKPGSNVALPAAKSGLVDAVLGSAACALRQKQDSAALAHGNPQVRDSIASSCGVRLTGPGRSKG